MNPDLLAVIEKTWGFRSLRPLQEQAIQAVLDRQDSLVVLPTGGGKSLCYQAPAVFRGDTTVVVSPLIALMKDQVDGLRACGVPAIQLDSSQDALERSVHEMDIVQGAVRLLFVAPERLMTPSFQSLLRQIRVTTFAIDEAHCISHWGHDFRPEYRQLQKLRERFPDASLHAYTATATERVRADIAQQLGLREPAILVGNFDRPNLTYRVVQKRELVKQILDILARHKNEAGIIYCIRRRDVDEMCAALKQHGHQPMPYHAGLTPAERKASQDAFINERCDIIVATVAFGMGIDRSNIRFVLHAGMPKSIEHYQQEAGRAGRDGLPSECVLLSSLNDFMTWKWILERSAADANAEPEFLRSALAHLEEVNLYCRSAACRHRALVEHFGQGFEPTVCNACDVCLGEIRTDPESTVIAQKILSCVARVNEGYGSGHLIDVLRGERTERVGKLQHDRLSTFGLLRDVTKGQIRDWIQQLLGQNLLDQVGEEYPVLKLNARSWEVMRAQRKASLIRRARREKQERAAVSTVAARSADANLFEALRRLRRLLAHELQVPPYVIFPDTTLRDLARQRPTTRSEMLGITGVGENKLARFGDRFLDLIRRFEG